MERGCGHSPSCPSDGEGWEGREVRTAMGGLGVGLPGGGEHGRHPLQLCGTGGGIGEGHGAPWLLGATGGPRTRDFLRDRSDRGGWGGVGLTGQPTRGTSSIWEGESCAAEKSRYLRNFRKIRGGEDRPQRSNYFYFLGVYCCGLVCIHWGRTNGGHGGTVVDVLVGLLQRAVHVRDDLIDLCAAAVGAGRRE